MNFEDTGLPDRPLFRGAFDAGLSRTGGDAAVYRQGPLAMARLIFERGGDCRQVAAAACLAGPAAFSPTPDEALDGRVVEFARQIVALEAAGDRADAMVPHLSADAKIFFQASAVTLLDQLARQHAPRAELSTAYTQALGLYSAARGVQDVYGLDTRFEIAAMKITTMLDSRAHLWVRAREHA